MKHENDSLNVFNNLQIYFRENLNDKVSHIQNLWLLERELGIGSVFDVDIRLVVTKQI